MNRVVNKTIKKTATPRTGRVIDAAGSKSVSVSEGAGGVLSHSHVNKALIDLINQGLSTESSVQFKDVAASGAITAGALNDTPPDDLPVATDLLYGVVKIDGITIKIDPVTGKIYAEASSGGVSSWNELTDIPQNLITIAALTGAGLIKRNADGTFNLDTTIYQTYDADLAVIAAIADGIGFLKRTGQNTWVIDTNTYLTSITKSMVESVLTGNITTHAHSQYLTAITKAMVEAVLAGTISSHWHPFIANSDTRDNEYLPYATAIKQGIHGPNLKLNTRDGLADGGTFHSSIYIHPWSDNTGGSAHNLAFTDNGNMYFRSGLTAWSAWKKLWHSVNSNLKTVDWNAKDAKVVNVIADISVSSPLFTFPSQTGGSIQAVGLSILRISGTNDIVFSPPVAAKIYFRPNGNFDSTNQAILDQTGTYYCEHVNAKGSITAGTLNGSTPTDLPVATSALFGVIKLGLSLHNNAGIVNINGRHYTAANTYTDSACRAISAEIPIGTGTIVNNETISIVLTGFPISSVKAPSGNIIANATTWAGVGMKVSFAKGSTTWIAFVTNDLGTSVTKDGISISVTALQTI